MRGVAWVILAGALLAGCGAPGTKNTDGFQSLRVGPALERLEEMFRDPKHTPQERNKYWESVRGRLVSARGHVFALESDHLVLDCPPTEQRPTRVTVRAYPSDRYATALSSFHVRQELTVSGELSGKEIPDSAVPDQPSTYELRNVRIRVH